MEEKLRSIMTDVFNVPANQITAETMVETVESWDSFNHINLTLALEKEFKVTFSPEEIITMASFREIIAILKQKIPALETSK